MQIVLRSGRRNIFFTACAGVFAFASAVPAFAQSPATPQRRNVIIFVCDGLRAGSVNATDSPTIYSLETKGVWFANSHSLFPTFTTPNASAMATGHYLGDTGDFSNVLFTGYPVFNKSEYGNQPGTVTPSVENDQILGDIDDHFAENYLTEESLLAYARGVGYDTAAIGKQGPVLIQDVTQGNIDPKTGAVAVPTTVIVDDSTGRPGGIPLSPSIQAALSSAGLAAVAPTRGANGLPGNNRTPGTLTANIVQQQYFADALTKAVLPAFLSDGKPFAVVFWSRDPDGTQHYQGDSLGKLVPGINGPTSRMAITNADKNLNQILFYLDRSGLSSNTDVVVVADHGFSTISHHEIDSSGTPVSSYAATFTYVDITGRQEVNTGSTPVGFVAIDLAHSLNLPLFDPDSQIKLNGLSVYEPVDPTIARQTPTERQHPVNGDGLIGGTGAIAAPTDAQVVIAANGGSDLIYLPTGSLAQRTFLANKVVNFLCQQNYVSGVFTDDAFGPIPGALPLSAINLKGAAALPIPAVIVNFRSFATDNAAPNQNAVTVCDNVLQEGQGMHGSFSRADTYNFMAAFGPDFKTNFVDHAPVSNADVQVTIASVLGFDIPSHGTLMGRVIREALPGPGSIKMAVRTGYVKAHPAANGKQTILRYQQLGSYRYFDAAGFAEETEGL